MRKIESFRRPPASSEKKKVFYATASIFFGSVFHQLAGKWFNLKDTFSWCRRLLVWIEAGRPCGHHCTIRNWQSIFQKMLIKCVLLWQDCMVRILKIISTPTVKKKLRCVLSEIHLLCALINDLWLLCVYPWHEYNSLNIWNLWKIGLVDRLKADVNPFTYSHLFKMVAKFSMYTYCFCLEFLGSLIA